MPHFSVSRWLFVGRRICRSARLSLPLAAVFLLLSPLPGARAEAAARIPLPAGTYRVLPAESRIKAFVRSTLHDFPVTVKVSKGELVLPLDGSADAVRLSLEFPAKETDSDNFLRDYTMRYDVLEAEKFPLARFLSQEVSFGGRDGEGRLRLVVKGTLTLHGVEKYLSIPVHVAIRGNRIRAEAKFALRISDYRMEVPSPLPFLKTEDEVEVTARLVLSAKDRLRTGSLKE